MREWERRRLNERGRQILQRGEGKAVRPQREDGYVNLLNKYGSQQDSSEAYRYEREPLIPDMQLTSLYEGNGLFAKIIDAPAEEALKHGFSLGLKNEALDAFVEDALDALEWEEKAAAAIKWARLYGGAIIVMLMDDGRGLEEPVDWKHIRSIDELRVYERAVVQPDYASLYRQDYGGRGAGNRTSKFGRPEFYDVSSIYGAFRVHESRCLLFRNGVLPELTTNTNYRLWGMPEYIRIQRALRETLTAHGDSVRLLERSVQAIYSMKNLAQLLAAEDGENQVLKRLQVIDMARGLLNSIAIDAEGESYDFKVAQFSGVRDVIDASCNMLSALTNIPQTLLFGRSPAGMNATGEGDLENWYSFVERIQKLMLRPNLRSLLDVTFRAGVACGDIAGAPAYRLRFHPLWSLSETEQAAVAQTKAQTAQIQAQTAQIYVDMQAMDPQEVRHRLARDEAFDVEDVVAEDEGEDLLRALYGDDPPGGEAQSGASQLQPTKVDRQDEAAARGVGVLLLQNGRLLCGTRADDGSLCGPGGHIGAWETPEEAAIRETQEEFGVTPKELIPVTTLTGMPAQYCDSVIYLCTEYDGAIACGGAEITGPGFLSPERALELMQNQPGRLFFPFALSIFRMIEALFPTENSPLTAGGKQGRVNDKGDFDESKHPRDEKGWFAPVGSGGASSKKPRSSRSSPGLKGFELGSKKDLDDAVKAGKIKMSLRAAKQSKHYLGTKKYEEAVARGDKVSILSISEAEIQQLVTERSGSGYVHVNKEGGQIRETIECGKPVGTYISLRGRTSETTCLTIHHSKKGFHVVPAISKAFSRSNSPASGSAPTSGSVPASGSAPTSGSAPASGGAPTSGSAPVGI